MTTTLLNRLEEFAFLLENGADVDAREIIHALDPRTAAPMPYAPKGSTGADAWMAQYGNPLWSTEAALRLARMVTGAGAELTMSVRYDGATASFVVGADRVTAASLPVAITAAACLYQLQQERET